MTMILTDEERQALVQAVVRDLVREAVVKPLVAKIASAFLANQGVPEIDYEALITACYERTRYAQGSKGCVAFKEGAEWFREQVLAAAPVAQQACDTPHYCVSVQRCTAMDEKRAVAQQAVPDGYKLVPVKPTPEMLGAGLRHVDGMASMPSAWAAMLDAAPEAPQAPAPQQIHPSDLKWLQRQPERDDGSHIVYDTEDVDDLTCRLTGDEGEDDSITVLQRLAFAIENRRPGKTVYDLLDDLDAAPEAPAPQPLTEPTEYTGVRCMCVLTGCQAGPGCPHYTEHCRKHIDHERAHGIGKGEAS